MKCAFAGLTSLACLAGACERPQQPVAQTTATLAEGEDITELWNNSLSALRKLGFVPDRQDRSVGVITTLPTTSKQWHEPWRQDVADRYSLLHASLHTTQRKVTVRFAKEQNWAVDVQVDVYRLSMPETQITSASSALHGFSGSLPTMTGQTTDGRTPPKRWVYLGRDQNMEDRVLERILAYADHRAS